MKARTRTITGWILSILVGLFLIAGSAIPKFISWEGKDAMMAHLGIPLDLLPILGCLEIVVTLLYMIPRTAFIGAILLTGYLGGALFTHVRIGDPWFFPLIIGGLAWIGLALRRPSMVRHIFGINPHATNAPGGQP